MLVAIKKYKFYTIKTKFYGLIIPSAVLPTIATIYLISLVVIILVS